MSKFDDAVAKYHKAMTERLGLDVDENLLRNVARGLGPTIYNPDAQLVSCSDEAELERVRTNFLVKKLGLADGPELMEAIREVCQVTRVLGSNKYRVVFYYLLTKKFGKESVYA